MYSFVFERFLARLDAERAHNWAARGIRLAGAPVLSPLVATLLGARGTSRIDIFGRTITSPLGIAAGFDKNAQMVEGLTAMGFGFVEIGTVTAHGQPGNDRPRLFRVVERRALRNHMGFNNDGADVVARRLAELRSTPAGRRVVLGVNIGKSKITPAQEAETDYRYSAELLAPYADYLVVNVSSPNTPGLRDLQAVASLEPIVRSVQAAADAAAGRHIPVLVKIAPDLADGDISEVAVLVRQADLAGVVAVNTTIAHEYGAGGLSGPLLKERGVEVVRNLRSELGPDRVIIGVGGISGSEDVAEYLNAGANLAQAYTGFIYGGPKWPGRIARRA